MSVYADTSFLVSLYISGRRSAEAERRMVSKPVMWLTPLHIAEWTHALEQHVFRGEINRSEADRLHHQFQHHRSQGLWQEGAVPDRAFEVCAQLALRHAAQIGLRTLDTLHVAAALELRCQAFWTFDERQKKLASAAGLQV